MHRPFTGLVRGVMLGLALWLLFGWFCNQASAHEQPAIVDPASTRDVWWRQARYVRVIDGDTIEVIVDLGFGVQIGHDPRLRIGLRILDIDTPEPNARDPYLRQKAAEATAFTRAWPQTHCGAQEADLWPIHIRTERNDSFGRYLAEVRCANSDASLAQDLLAAGLAVPYE